MEATMPAQSGRVLMLPGFGGEASQPILVALDVALRERGIPALRGSLRRGRPSPGLRQEVEDARRQLAGAPAVSAYAGRSFGGRVLARVALEVTPRALVLLGFPVRSASGRSRLDDEAVLERLACPTLIVQGAADPLGPIRSSNVSQGTNPRLELEVVRGASHVFGRHQGRAVEVAADWLAGRLR